MGPLTTADEAAWQTRFVTLDLLPCPQTRPRILVSYDPVRRARGQIKGQIEGLLRLVVVLPNFAIARQNKATLVKRKLPHFDSKINFTSCGIGSKHSSTKAFWTYVGAVTDPLIRDLAFTKTRARPAESVSRSL